MMNESIVMSADYRRILMVAMTGGEAVLQITGSSGYTLNWIVWESDVDGRLEISYGALPSGKGFISPASYGVLFVANSRIGTVYGNGYDIRSDDGWIVPTMSSEEIAEDLREIRWRPDKRGGVIGIDMNWTSS